MTMRVTMLKEAFGPNGALYAVGSTQTVADDIGAAWVHAGMARDTDLALKPPVDTWNSRTTQAGNALVSGDGVGKRLRIALVGDSLHARTYVTTSLTNQPTYDSSTGVLTFVQTSHGHFTGMLCRITSGTGDLFTGLSLTRVDANTFSVQVGAGRTILSSTANWHIGLESAYHSEGPFTWLRPSRPKLYNFGIAGATSDAIRAYSLPPALASDANVIWLRAGSNDVSGGTVAATYANIAAMTDDILASGKQLILSTIPPFGTSATTGAFTANLAALVRNLAANLKGCAFIDEHAIGVDPLSATGTWLTGYSSDNTHFTAKMARLVGLRLQSVLDDSGASGPSPCPTSALDAYNVTNNPTSTQPFPTPTLITATGGTAGSGTTGTVAANMTTFATGAGSPAASVVSATIGNAQQLVGTPAANNDLLRCTSRASESTVAGLVTAGQRRKAVCRLKVTGLTGQSVLQSFGTFVVFTNADGTFNSRICDHNWSGTAAQQNQADLDLDIETGEFVVPAGVTSLYIDPQVRFTGAGTAVTVQVSQVAFPLVT